MGKNNTVVILDQASGYLQIDMLDALAEKYGKCVIIAGTIVERETKLSPNYKWHKIIKYNKSTPLKRVFTWTWATLQMFFIVLLHYRKARIVAITNPPLAPFVPYMLRLNYDVLVYDLYPDALVNFGYISSGGWVHRVFAKYTQKMLMNARTIYTLTPELAKKTSKYSKEKEIKIIPIWTNNEFFPKIDRRENEIFKKFEIPLNHFIVCYSGNLGKTHPIENIVQLALDLQGEDIHFFIIGGGHKYTLIAQQIRENNLININLLPWQPVELLPHNIQVGDLNIVTLDDGAADLSIPSKTFNLLSVGKPILAICSKQSALSNLLDRYRCGKAFESHDLEGVKLFISELKDNPELYKVYSENARLASLDFGKDNAQKFK